VDREAAMATVGMALLGAAMGAVVVLVVVRPAREAQVTAALVALGLALVGVLLVHQAQMALEAQQARQGPR
jgi:hypothetical protein